MQVLDWLARQARQNPDKIALVELASGRQVSFAELDARASRVATHLRSWQMPHGSRVAILAHNSIDYIEWLYGCARARMVAVCLNWRLSLGELASIFADADPRAIIFSQEFSEAAKKLAELRGIGRLLCLGKESAALLEAAEAGPPDWGWRDENEPWYLFYTPGQNGQFCGVIQTFGMNYLNAVNAMQSAGVSAADQALSVMPFYQTSGLNLYVNPLLMVGGTSLISRQFSASATLQRLRSGATLFFGVPTIYRLLAEHPDFANSDLSGVRHWGCGSLPMPDNWLQPWRERGIAVCCGYGLAESGPMLLSAASSAARAKPGCVGQPMGSVSCRVVDAHGLDQAPGERGELLVRGPSITPGYWQNTAATAAAFSEGWLHTGDIACVDADGDFYIVDRAKASFSSGGEMVYPGEIENVLALRPEIAENIVFAVPDARWGEVAKAMIALRPGASLTEEEVKAHCKQHLAGFKVPKYIEFISALPRNANGKIDKRRLRLQSGSAV